MTIINVEVSRPPIFIAVIRRGQEGITNRPVLVKKSINLSTDFTDYLGTICRSYRAGMDYAEGIVFNFYIPQSKI